MAVHGSHVAVAVLFAVLYAIIFAFLTYLYSTRQIVLRSRWTFIYLHVIIRIASQALGLSFAIVGWSGNGEQGWQILVAFLILGAEGYFSLVLTAYRFMVKWDIDRYGGCVLEHKLTPASTRRDKVRAAFRSPMAQVHWTLLAANSVIIAGGCMAASQASLDPDISGASSVTTGKILRAVGSSIFLVLVQVFLALCFQRWRRGPRDSTLIVLLCCWPFLTVRGVFGLVQTLGHKFSYYNWDNYDEHGLVPSFLAAEYVLGTATEWVACVLLCATYFCRQPSPGPINTEEGEKPSW